MVPLDLRDLPFKHGQAVFPGYPFLDFRDFGLVLVLDAPVGQRFVVQVYVASPVFGIFAYAGEN